MTNFFVNLLDMSTTWMPAADYAGWGTDRKTDTAGWTATQVHLAFGSSPQWRAIAKLYA